MKLKRKGYRTQRGYTLMEVLIVATIVGILLTIGSVQYLEVKRRSKENLCAQKLNQLAVYEKMYFRENGFYADWEDLLYDGGYVDESYVHPSDTLLHYDRPVYIPEYTLEFIISDDNLGYEIIAEPVIQDAYLWYPRWVPLGGIPELRSMYVDETGVVKWLANGRPVY